MQDRARLLQLVDADPQLCALLQQVRARADQDASHDEGHLLRVAIWTLRFAADDVEPREAVAAALLHDLVNVPKSSPERRRASELSAEHARAMLEGEGFAPEAIARVAEAIRDHSYSRGATPRSPLGRALQDADRLEALGAIGIFRTVATGVRMSAGFFDPADPWAERRALDDRRFTVDHFFEKLLRLPATMTTSAGRAEAGRRARFMVAFLRQLGDELGMAPPASRFSSL